MNCQAIAKLITYFALVVVTTSALIAQEDAAARRPEPAEVLKGLAKPIFATPAISLARPTGPPSEFPQPWRVNVTGWPGLRDLDYAKKEAAKVYSLELSSLTANKGVFWTAMEKIPYVLKVAVATEASKDMGNADTIAPRVDAFQLHGPKGALQIEAVAIRDNSLFALNENGSVFSWSLDEIEARKAAFDVKRPAFELEYDKDKWSYWGGNAGWESLAISRSGTIWAAHERVHAGPWDNDEGDEKRERERTAGSLLARGRMANGKLEFDHWLIDLQSVLRNFRHAQPGANRTFDLKKRELRICDLAFRGDSLYALASWHRGDKDATWLLEINTTSLPNRESVSDMYRELVRRQKADKEKKDGPDTGKKRSPKTKTQVDVFRSMLEERGIRLTKEPTKAVVLSQPYVRVIKIPRANNASRQTINWEGVAFDSEQQALWLVSDNLQGDEHTKDLREAFLAPDHRKAKRTFFQRIPIVVSHKKVKE